MDFTARDEQNYSVRDALLVPAIALGVIMVAFLPMRMIAPKATVTALSVISATNEVRLANGLAPLQADRALSVAAAAKAQDMIKQGYFAHYHNGHTPWEYIDAAAGKDWKVAGENLAKNYNQASDLMQAWMNSPSHKENILDTRYDTIGVAVVRAISPDGKPVSVTVQLFTGG